MKKIEVKLELRLEGKHCDHNCGALSAFEDFENDPTYVCMFFKKFLDWGNKGFEEVEIDRCLQCIENYGKGE
jgi:hypothetical protein